MKHNIFFLLSAASRSSQSRTDGLPLCSGLLATAVPSPSRAVLSPSSQPFQRRRMMVRWQPPPVGWFKLNFDGSVYNGGSRRASIGGFIRHCHTHIVLAFAELTEHSTVGVVEARALIRGVRLALEHILGRLVVEGDDLVLVQLLRGEETQTRIPMAMQQEIEELLRRFSACEVRHLYRDGNQVAHVLCRQAYERPRLWKGGLILPRAVGEKLQDDLDGVAHELTAMQEEGVRDLRRFLHGRRLRLLPLPVLKRIKKEKSTSFQAIFAAW